MLGLLMAMTGVHRRQLLPAAALLLYLPAVHIWLHTEARYSRGSAAVAPVRCCVRFRNGSPLSQRTVATAVKVTINQRFTACRWPQLRVMNHRRGGAIL